MPRDAKLIIIFAAYASVLNQNMVTPKEIQSEYHLNVIKKRQLLLLLPIPMTDMYEFLG